jgi:hypothetical protein
MKAQRGRTIAEYGWDGLIVLFVICPVIALLCIFAGSSIIYRLIHGRHLDFAAAAGSFALLLIGAGLLQFTYLLLFKPSAHLSTGIIYLASISFMAIGTVVLSFCLFGSTGIQTFRGIYAAAGMISIGFIGFRFARARKIQNQSADPTLASGTPRAGHEPRHR